MPKIVENGIERDMTSAEIEQAAAHTKVNVDAKKVRTDAATAKAIKKASGKQKLLDLGLSEDEVQALIGV